MSEPLVRITDVSKTFTVRDRQGRRRIRAVDGVSLTLLRGRHLGLVGESGSGKTTLGRMIAGLHRPDAGEIRLRGRRLEEIPRRLRGIQMVFQDPHGSLDPRMRIRRVLAEADDLVHRGASRAEREARFREVLASVDLPADALDRYPSAFSGGERQRIAVARSLLMRPDLLILDEAVSSLDVLVQARIVSLLARLQETHRMTYLFISHNLRVVRQLCPEIAVMYRGRIVEVAGTTALFGAARHPYTRDLLAAAVDYRAAERTGDYPLGGRLEEIEEGHRVLSSCLHRGGTHRRRA